MCGLVKPDCFVKTYNQLFSVCPSRNLHIGTKFFFSCDLLCSRPIRESLLSLKIYYRSSYSLVRSIPTAMPSIKFMTPTGRKAFVFYCQNTVQYKRKLPRPWFCNTKLLSKSSKVKHANFFWRCERMCPAFCLHCWFFVIQSLATVGEQCGWITFIQQ